MQALTQISGHQRQMATEEKPDNTDPTKDRS